MHRSVPMNWIRLLAAAAIMGWGAIGIPGEASASAAPTVSFSVSPSVSQLGSSSTLTWSSTNANSCTLSGAASGTLAPQSGSNPIVVEPSAVGSYTYNLSCTGSGGSAAQSVTLHVDPLPVPIVSYSLSPSVGQVGGSTTLIWASTYAGYCALSGAWTASKLAAQSSTSSPVTFTLGEVGSYTSTLTCTGSGGSASRTVTLQVVEPPPTLSFTIAPPIVPLGGGAALNWSSTNATACSRSGAWSGTANTSGSSDPVLVRPTAAGTYTYTLSCTGSGGTINNSATLQVTSAQDVQFLDAQIEAAQQTANNTSATSSCGVISQNQSGSEDGFYWEIGNESGIIADSAKKLSASGSVQPAGTQGTNYTRTTEMQIDSATKWLYGSYVAETKAELTDNTWQFPSAYLPFLHFTSGYADMTDNCTAAATPTVQDCLEASNGASPPVPNGTKNSADAGLFYYNSGHLEVFEGGGDPSIAGVMNGANNNVTALANEVTTALSNAGVTVNLTYSAPEVGGGVQTTPGDYAAFMQGLIRTSNPLVMGALLLPAATDTYAVCTNPYDTSCVNSSGQPLAAYSPLPGDVSWDYSITHWIESDPVSGDGAYSSPGKTGFYPWVDSTKTYYGMVARYDTNATNVATSAPFYLSAVCGAAIRTAFMTGSATPPPLAPSDLAVTSTSAGSVALSWTAASGASDYYVFYGTAAGGETTKSAAVTGTSTAITGLSSSTTYYFVVKAYNHATALTSQPSNEVSALANTAFTLAAPTKLTATATASAGQVTLSWTASAGASDYYVYSSPAGGSTAKSAAVTATSTTFIGLTSGTEYSFVVEAYNHANAVTSAASNAASATPN
jgi:hypothetical protein